MAHEEPNLVDLAAKEEGPTPQERATRDGAEREGAVGKDAGGPHRPVGVRDDQESQRLRDPVPSVRQGSKEQESPGRRRQANDLARQ